jgi:lytic murein transglycosylase
MEGLGGLLAGGILVSAALLLAEPAGAQSQAPAGGGLTAFLDNIFAGPDPEASPQRLPRSGRNRGSDNPLMTAAAIRKATANFGNCLASMWPAAAHRDVSPASFERFTAGVEPNLHIMHLLDAQPEFTKPIWDYLDSLITADRLATGREILAQYKQDFDTAERTYGVDRYTLAAIWGIESNFSTQMGNLSVVQSTATLACIGRRQPYFRKEFLAALEILNDGDLTPDEMRGSWAGAFGPTQFMPTAFLRYAVDADGDGRRDVVDDPADLLASTANSLRKDGWRTGRTWGYEVIVPRGFNYMLADRSRTMTIARWERLGIKRAIDRPFPRPTDKAYLLLPAGSEGPAFLMLRNFRAIMKYNPAEAYALAIGHFADRLRGGGPFVQPWPRQERDLSRFERLELQQLLAQRGFYRGAADGKIGGRTREALRRFQASIGVPADGFASAEVLERLRH